VLEHHITSVNAKNWWKYHRSAGSKWRHNLRI